MSVPQRPIQNTTMAMGSVLCGFLWFWLLWHDAKPHEIDPARCKIWGPGLTPDRIVMPARYFFIELVDSLDQRFALSLDTVRSSNEHELNSAKNRMEKKMGGMYRTVPDRSSMKSSSSVSYSLLSDRSQMENLQ